MQRAHPPLARRTGSGKDAPWWDELRRPDLLPVVVPIGDDARARVGAPGERPPHLPLPADDPRALREEEERRFGLIGDDSVAEHPELVDARAEETLAHPIGHPISASTNRGFKTRPSLEIGLPSFPILRTRGPRRTALSVSDVPGCAAPPRDPLAFSSPAVGVGQSPA